MGLDSDCGRPQGHRLPTYISSNFPFFILTRWTGKRIDQFVAEKNHAFDRRHGRQVGINVDSREFFSELPAGCAAFNGHVPEWIGLQNILGQPALACSGFDKREGTHAELILPGPEDFGQKAPKDRPDIGAP